MLGSGIMISLSVGLFATLALKKYVSGLSIADERFYSFLIGSICFHLVGLILAHVFLRAHEVTWAQFLGLDAPHWGRAALIGLGVCVLAFPVVMGLHMLSGLLITA